MESAIEWYEANTDHDLELSAWAHLLLSLDNTEYRDKPLPQPTNVLPTMPTLDEYRKYGDNNLTPKGYVIRSRHRQGFALWHPMDARWDERDIACCIGPKVTSYHLKANHGDTSGCKYFAFVGFTIFAALTPRAKACIAATEHLAKSTVTHLHPIDTNRHRRE